ncbi:ribonuclease H1-like [Leguminivora glycinivorella]|uniref:ribonuclease H1-like n=1 Tax=Leguminivora glycinivorella TaxID=1035111 RepID=UPI00200BDFD1|nr:ribonuclease H1-like [Leguminivora glycinivorella]
MSGIFRKTLNICLFQNTICEYFICRTPKIVKMPFYAVARGRSTGIYHSWADCEAQVKGFSGAKFKKFDTESDANDFIRSNSNAGNNGNKSTYNNYQSGTNKNLKRSYGTSSKNNNYYQNKSSSWTNEADSNSSEDDLDVILNKQMDDLEKRVNNFAKGIDKISKSAAKGSSAQAKKTILIEPPQPKKYKHAETIEFEIDDEGYVQVYTDGACSANGKQGARAGLGVFWSDSHPLNRSQPVSGRATNNCGEIQAATLAIKIALQNGITKLTINTDSQFLINVVTIWIPGWKRRGWKLASGEAVKNEIDFKDLDSVMHKLLLKWNYVKAHNGKHGNEMADRLAKAGAAMYNK